MKQAKMWALPFFLHRSSIYLRYHSRLNVRTNTHIHSSFFLEIDNSLLFCFGKRLERAKLNWYKRSQFRFSVKYIAFERRQRREMLARDIYSVFVVLFRIVYVLSPTNRTIFSSKQSSDESTVHGTHSRSFLTFERLVWPCRLLGRLMS